LLADEEAEVVTAAVGANVEIVGGTRAFALEPAPDEVLLLVSQNMGTSNHGHTPALL